MSANAQAVRASALTLTQSSVAVSAVSPFAACVGFYLSFRLILPLLAVHVFGQDAQGGVVVSLALNYLLLLLAVFDTLGRSPQNFRSPFRVPCFRWVLLFLGFSGVSLLWSVTASLSAAIAFWCAMVADTAMVVLLLRSGPIDTVVNSLMRGYIWGSCAIAAIAWLLPAQSDLRLGDEELLGPNQIGWACAFAFFLAQYLMRKKSGNWTMPAFLLAVTLLRSLSKTTIIAFLAGQAYILLRDTSMRRRTKLLVVAFSLLVLVVFSRLLAEYYVVYTNAGNQAETLTGRLGIWLYFLSEAVQKPWIGHGFHSVWKVIPPFKEFEARHAHNELLQQFYAYGAVGVFMLVAIYGSVWRHLRRLSDVPLKTFFLGMLLFVIVRGAADTEAFDLSLPLWFIALIGALIEHSQTRREVLA
ncbi:MAG TPA: O-antigen ligase family protein [Acidobacteriaceae bacterium]|jgi:O-antigen ligase